MVQFQNLFVMPLTILNTFWDAYSVTMVRILRTEQIWKAGILSTPEKDENLLKDAIFNIMDAIRRNVESKRLRYKDKVLPHVFVMNTYWYIYMRTKSTELGKLMGDQYMKKTYKIVAEESAYSYQKQAWGPLRMLTEKNSRELTKTDLLLWWYEGNGGVH
ncbi:hypothetical protein HAX54_031407 [Datura stramonium]|uniref:Exocyst subunit Exo70 family protein n=1 Tax=Datura stramonium TaxID=4076 RepID=A0ABS8V971_DATST|nr:hypothetical protein [Datura stramonium]